MPTDTRDENSPDNKFKISTDDLTKWAAPSLAIMTGLLFLAGYIYRRLLIGSLGLGGNYIGHPFQEVMADGYVALVFFAILLLISSALAWIPIVLLYHLISRISGRHLGFFNRGKSGLATIYESKFYAAYNLFTMTFMTLILGMMAGALYFIIHVSLIQSRLQSCNNFCFKYAYGKKSAIGIPIIGDSDHLVIYQKSGALIINTDDIVEVTPPQNQNISENPDYKLPSSIWSFITKR